MPSKIQYNIVIETSNFSENCRKIDLKLVGEKYKSERIKLNSSPSDSDRKKILRNSFSAFRIEEIDVKYVCIFYLKCLLY